MQQFRVLDISSWRCLHLSDRQPEAARSRPQPELLVMRAAGESCVTRKLLEVDSGRNDSSERWVRFVGRIATNVEGHTEEFVGLIRSASRRASPPD